MESSLNRRIAESLSSISPHDLQVLAESLAVIKFPHRFRHRQLVRRGRNDEGQTTKGWPDAYVLTDDGKVDAIEATRQKQDWAKHLEEDYQKAASKDEHKLIGYTFVGGYPTHAPTASEIESWSKRFASIGVSAENICLLIGKELVLELAEPQYARILTDTLKIPVIPKQFRLLKPGSNVENPSALYKPSELDFERNLVTKPSIFQPIVHTLNKSRIALIRGHGASGKTTLAHLLAHTISPSPTYYLDLGTGELSQNYSHALQDLAEFAVGATFVVDNVHLDESSAVRLIDDWNKYSKRHDSRLLLLGRETSEKRGSPIGGIPPTILRAGRSEMRGIVSRVLNANGFAVPTFEDDTYTEWLRLFGGPPDNPDVTVDLVAFGAAVQSRAKPLSGGDHRLTLEDSTNAIRTYYLSNLSPGETRNILRLSALEEIELSLPSHLLTDRNAAFTVSSQKLGLVFREVSSNGKETYRLAHPALGNLLTVAVDPLFDLHAEQVAVAEEDVSLGFRILSRTKDELRRSNLKDRLQAHMAKKTFMSGLQNLLSVLGALQPALRLKLVTSNWVDVLLATSDRFKGLYFSERALNAIVATNSWIRDKNLIETSAALETNFNDPQLLSRVVETLCVSDPALVSGFINSHQNGQFLLLKIDRDRWNASQRIRPPSLIAHTASALKLFDKRGRPELAIQPAALILSSPNRSLWMHANLTHLSHMVRLASPISQEILTRLLTETITADWLDQNYRTLGTGPLSGTLMSLANYLPRELHHMLLTKTLSERVQSELTKSRWSYKASARAISLLGTCDSLGSTFKPTLPADWPSEQEIDSIVCSLPEMGEPRMLGMYELQLWLGLKSICSLTTERRLLTPSQGDTILSLIREATPPTKQAAASQRCLLAWLEESAINKWKLAPPK